MPSATATICLLEHLSGSGFLGLHRLFGNPPTTLAEGMDPVFLKLCNQHEIIEAARNFFIKEGLVTVEKFAAPACDEKEVQKEIVDPMIAGGVQFPKLADKGNIKLLWTACKKMGKQDDRENDDAAGTEAPIKKEIRDDMDALWFRVHGFVIPDDWFLIANHQGKMFRSFNCETPRLEQLLLEEMRPMSSCDKSVGKMFAVMPGKSSLEMKDFVADVVKQPMEILVRIRAYFTTMAFVSIKKPAFFDFQTALFMSDKVLGFVSQTFDGQRPPASFYAAAWAATVHHLGEQIRVSGSSLKDAVKNTGGWEHRWTGWTPPANASGNGNVGVGRPSGPDLPQHILDEMQKLKEQVRHWQGQADHYRIKIDKKDRDEKDRGKDSRGKGGKHSFKDNSRGQGQRHPDRHHDNRADGRGGKHYRR